MTGKRPEDVINHGSTHEAWRTTLTLETIFLLILIAGVLAIFVAGLVLSHARIVDNVGVVAVCGGLLGTIVHHFRHMRQIGGDRG